MTSERHSTHQQSKKAFLPQNTMVILSLMGFDDIRQVDDTFVSFRFGGQTYETARMEGHACIGTVRGLYSEEECFSGMKAGEDLMKENPSLQCYYSAYEEQIRIRLWLDCNSALEYEKAVLKGIDELEGVNDSFQARVQHHMFKMVAPIFDNIIHSQK